MRDDPRLAVLSDRSGEVSPAGKSTLNRLELTGSDATSKSHGYYRHYCYLPACMFCGKPLLCARLRSADQAGAAGAVDELKPIVARIRRVWPDTRILLQGDSGYCREALTHWCENKERPSMPKRGTKRFTAPGAGWKIVSRNNRWTCLPIALQSRPACQSIETVLLLFGVWADTGPEAIGLAGTEMATAQCGTIRLKLFKTGARIRLSVGKVW